MRRVLIYGGFRLCNK